MESSPGKRKAEQVGDEAGDTSKRLHETAAYELNATDVLAITNLIHGFLQCLDTGDGAGFARLFAPGAALEVTKAGIVKRGSAELAALCVGLHGRFSRCQHWEGNLLIEAGDVPNTARNRSYWQALEGAERVSMGRHEDTFVRGADGSWLFSARRVVHSWTKSGGFEPIDDTPSSTA